VLWNVRRLSSRRDTSGGTVQACQVRSGQIAGGDKDGSCRRRDDGVDFGFWELMSIHEHIWAEGEVQAPLCATLGIHRPR
jgi:hypothetical protein